MAAEADRDELEAERMRGGCPNAPNAEKAYDSPTSNEIVWLRARASAKLDPPAAVQHAGGDQAEDRQRA